MKPLSHERYDKKTPPQPQFRFSSRSQSLSHYLPAPVVAQARAKCKLGYHRVFNLILWVLYTGMQWKCLPVREAGDGTAVIHYTTIYKVCLVPRCDGALSFLTRQEEDALWQVFFTAAPEQHRAFEPSSKKRKRRPVPPPDSSISIPKPS